MAVTRGTRAPPRLAQLLERRASLAGDSPALAARDEALGYGELWQQVSVFAQALVRSGLAPGDRVAIYQEKVSTTVVAIFGASAAGAVFVPVNPVLRPRQVAHILDDSGTRILVTSPERLELLRDVLGGCESLERVIVTGQAPERPPGFTGELHGWDELGGGEESLPDGTESDMAAILYTSGSTGSPKGVVLSHRNLIAGAESVCEYLGNHEEDRLLAALPLSFDAGFSQLTTGFLAGAQVVLHDYLLPGDAVRACAEHRITGLTCVPPLWIQLVDQDWPPEARESMRYFASTGGRMPRPTLEKLRSTFPEAVPFLMYGLTEAFRSTYLDPAEVDRRPDSIGKSIPNAEILVVREDGTRCEPGEEGELVHRGPLVALGYWKDPERTAERFRPAPGQSRPTEELAVWSGDVVRTDEDGFLYFVGRRDEMIKTSGYRVSPTEIEEVAYGTGLVRDAVALGVDDPRLGQRIVLAVSAPGEVEEKALLGLLAEELPPYMLPKAVVIRDELPRSPNGKLDRNLLREELDEA